MQPGLLAVNPDKQVGQLVGSELLYWKFLKKLFNLLKIYSIQVAHPTGQGMQIFDKLFPQNPAGHVDTQVFDAVKNYPEMHVVQSVKLGPEQFSHEGSQLAEKKRVLVT
jgi:hypothetical protein